jgi:hypothetical protein
MPTMLAHEVHPFSCLTYNIVEERLSGMIGPVPINCCAGSGGRAGTKTKNGENWYLKNNALATHVHSGAHQYGPLPQGKYNMRPHETDKHMVRLDPFPSNIMHGRRGFLIHGRGKIGSHGCIVPYEFGDVLKIHKAVEDYIKSYKADPILQVIAVGSDVDRKFFTA